MVAVSGAADHRQEGPRLRQAWLSPIDPDNEATFDEAWRDALGDRAETGVTLRVLGRDQFWPRATDDLLRASFAGLCGFALGPEDYLAIAARFHTVFLEDVPRLGPDKRDQASALQHPDRRPL